MHNEQLFHDTIVREIRRQSSEMDISSTLSASLLDFIYEHGLFKLFVPKKLGGHMAALPEALRIFEDAAQVDGNLGWTVTIGSGGGYFAAYMPQAIMSKLFAHKKAVVAGSGYPSGIAKKVDGGYAVNGAWKYCSGSTHATVFTVNCETEQVNDTNHTEIRTMILLPDQVQIIEDWQTFGLTATASHTIQAINVFVPDYMTFQVIEENNKLDDLIYRFSFQHFAEASFAAVALGIGRHFIEEAKSLAAQHKEAWEASHLNRYEFVTSLIEAEQHKLDQASADFYKHMDSVWDRHAAYQTLSGEEWRDASRICKHTSRTALTAAQHIFPYLGTNAIQQNAAINQIYRDVHTACQHTLLVSYDNE